MDKEEAMKILKDFHDKSALFSVRTALDTIIPELRESDDEKIRKALIRFHKSTIDIDGIKGDDIIAWLERQGEETSWKPSKEEMDVLYGLAYITNQYDEHKEEVITRLYQDLKREFFNDSSYENMFPANTNTEDGVRRRSTIQVLEYARSLDTYNQYGKADIDKNIAWVEKQGDANKEYWRGYREGKQEILDKYAELEKQKEPELSEDFGVYVAELSKQFPEVSFAKLSRIVVRVKNWLEKQGEYSICNIPSREVILAIWELGNEWKGLTTGSILEHGTQLDYIQKHWHESTYYLTKKQGEQKPTDKVEPKFQNGQWIVWQNKCYKVNDNGCGYELIDQNGLSTSLEYGTVDKSAHLWTIQDAKDGDVLVASDSSIFIFKEVRGSSCKHYIALTSDNEIQVNTKLDKFWETARGVKPSTKEQRDTLLKAIADAGYTFDFEKKELKKIEKKSQRMVSAEAKEALYDKPTDEEMKELLRTEYEKGRADAIAEMKKDWSEEDEKNLQGIIDEIQANKNSAPSYDIPVYEGFLNWLKPLKDRLQPQPKQEWSEKDEKILNNLIDYIKVDDALQYSEKQVVNWLKSLKDRYTWKPSSEQIDTLEHFIRSIGESGYALPYDNNTKLLYSLLEQLKKLKA